MLYSLPLLVQVQYTKAKKKKNLWLHCGKAQQLDSRPPSGQGSAQSLPGLKHQRCRHLEDDVPLQIKVMRLNHSQMDPLFLLSGISTHLPRL